VTKSFLTYPTGLAGGALLLLRIAVAAAFFIEVSARYGDWLVVGSALIAIVLLAGIFTRVIAAFCAIAIIGFAIEPTGYVAMLIGLHGLSAAALAMLGAGAYSIDGRMFGRHVVTFRKSG
jgi:hypothetical protein